MENSKGPPALSGDGSSQAAADSAWARVGSIIGDRYHIEGLLGHGGMGIVYAAVHKHTHRHVALKLIHCAWNDDRLQLYQRFLGEARAASAIHHPNVVDVLDMGFHAGAPYLVMERLVGESLECVLDGWGVLPLDEAVQWLLPVMGALAALHERGVVHRDVKPSNIFLCHQAQRVVPKLLDFGLARLSCEAPLTQPDLMLGTPEYMAPERMRGQSGGPELDVWSMGIVLFESLCGGSPYTAMGLNALAAQVLTGELRSPLSVNPRLHHALAGVIDRALQFDPQQRYPDMASFAYAFGQAALDAGACVPSDPDPLGLPAFAAVHMRGRAWASGPLVAGQPNTQGARDGGVRRVRRSAPILLVCVAVISAAAGAIWRLWPTWQPATTRTRLPVTAQDATPAPAIPRAQHEPFPARPTTVEIVELTPPTAPELRLGPSELPRARRTARRARPEGHVRARSEAGERSAPPHPSSEATSEFEKEWM